MIYAYTTDELNHMSIADLSSLTNAASALNGAMANWGDREKDWRPGIVTLRHTFTNSWYELSRVTCAKESAIRKAWTAVFTACTETHTDRQIAISHMWEHINRLTYLSDTTNGLAVQEMKHFTEDLIWDNSDNPDFDLKYFRNGYARRESNATKALWCRKWCRADWRFGRPDVK